MSDDKRLATLKALTTYLETEITVANGYQHDLTNAVFRGRMFYSVSDPIPSISILENLNPDRFPRRAGGDDNASAPDAAESWILLLQGWTADDKTNPTDTAYPLMADVKKALAKLLKGKHPVTGLGADPNYMLGGLIHGLKVEPGTVRPPDEISAKAYFYIRLILGFNEKLADPYSLT